jgi:hypothetical protein
MQYGIFKKAKIESESDEQKSKSQSDEEIK